MKSTEYYVEKITCTLHVLQCAPPSPPGPVPGQGIILGPDSFR